MLCLLHETKYQSHVRIRIRGFVSGSRPGWCLGSCPGSGPVRVWLVSGFVSGACQVSVCVRI